MCWIGEIALFVVGIVTLIKGRLTLTSKKVVIGRPAYALGIIMVTSLPLIFISGLFFPLLDQLLFGGVPNPMALYFWFEVLLFFAIVAVVLVIGFATGRPPSTLSPTEQR